MKIYKGWYRKSLARKDTVWHRVYYIDTVVSNQIFGDAGVFTQMASTVCGRSIPATKCDFDIDPDNKCMQCELPVGVLIETGSAFVPTGLTPMPTRAEAIVELKYLLKPQIYYVRIWDCYGVKITAKWESDVSISIYTETEIITKKRTKRVMTLEQVQADLVRFKSAIDCLCDASDTLALKEKKKKKLKGKLTEDESITYFEKLLYQAEK